MIAPPRSPSGQSSSRTIELRDLGRTGLRPSRRHTSQTLVGYAVPSAVTPGSGNPGASVPVNSNNLSPPQSGQVTIPAPIIEESSTALPPAEQPSAPSTNNTQQPLSSISSPGATSVAEGTWAKVSAIATLYQAVLATIQTAGGIAFGVAAIVVGVKALQLAQLEYCEERKSDNPSMFCKLLVRAGVESTAVFRRNAGFGGMEADKPTLFFRFLTWLSSWRERLTPSHEVPGSVIGKFFKFLAWAFILGPWEDAVQKVTGCILLLGVMVNAFFVCVKVLVPLLAWRSWVLMQLLDGNAPQAPRLTSRDLWSRVAAASKPLILCLAMSDALSPVGAWVLSWAGQVVLFLVAAATGLFVCLVLLASWGLDSRRNTGVHRVSGLEMTGQVVFAVSLIGLAHTTETGPIVFFSICQLVLSVGGFVVAGYHRFKWGKLASVGIDGLELLGIIHVVLTVGDIFFPNRTTLWALGVKTGES
ncbi:hypothetical protein B0T18DRAFT_97894 [Schizothecium vesticola]|uniref:Uncharacterized protein n=1 Tax=Schizothecium vesticola TaxID=314040 RepID=A0AA40K8B2_9PEZI|nr:hypothetical protein B0T18DRAFT_97894 [Schizothecium vesticola]